MRQKTKLFFHSGTFPESAHGSIPFGMTNDYMFRAVLQSNNKALRGLICSLLHLNDDDVFSVEITNPIILGESVKDKEFRLDINVKLNNSRLINLEMQIAGKLSWPNRSISYLCRSFNTLNRGQKYNETMPVIHIGFLDYTLFSGCPEFHATYKLLNTKNHCLYSDLLTLSVIDLSRIDLACEEDKKYHIDIWAKLFKASTWEEIKMLSAKDPYIDEASNSIFQLNADPQVLKRCLDREEYYLDRQADKEIIAESKAVIRAQKKEIRAKDKALTAKDNELTAKNNELAVKDNEISRLRSLLEKHGIIPQ